jgi:8-amino-7-oxononanoate synthase
MLEQGVYVNMSRPPATPMGVFLLRCSLCADHTAAQVDTVLARFATAAAMTGLFAEAAE